MRFIFTFLLLASIKAFAQAPPENCKGIQDIALMERLGHEIVAEAHGVGDAFNAFDDGRGIFPDAIKRIADALDLFLQFLCAGKVSGAMRLDHFHIKFWKQIRAATHAALTIRQRIPVKSRRHLLLNRGVGQ